MSIPKFRRVLALAALATLSSSFVFAQIDARMLRYPAVSKDQIAFVYAGDSTTATSMCTWCRPPAESRCG